MNLNEIRQKFPQYNDLSDEQLADSFHKKYYSDMPKEDFYSKIGLNDKTREDSDSFIKKHLINPIVGAQGRNTLETAGNLADLLINQPIESTGLPSFARGVFQGGENLIRGIGNIPADIAEYSGNKINPIEAPGLGQVYPIPKTEFPKPSNVNPYLGETAEAAGNLLSIGGVNKLYQGSKKAIESLPYLKNLPKYAQNIISGTVTGASISPEDRKVGAGLGAAGSAISETVPALLNKILNLKPNAYKAIQEGYDTKLKKLSNMFESVEKDVAQKGIKQIKLPEKFYIELEEIGPQSKTFKRFLEKAKSGSYKDLRNLNTELFKRGTKYASSPFPSDVERAEDMFAARDNLNEIISKSLKHVGLDKSANTLNKAMSGYKGLKNTYTSHPSIAKLVGPNRLVPRKSTILKEDSERMKLLKTQHPEIEKQLKYEKKLNTALGLGLGSTGLGTAYEILKTFQ